MTTPQATRTFAGNLEIDGFNPLLNDHALKHVELQLQLYARMPSETAREAELFRQFVSDQGYPETVALLGRMGEVQSADELIRAEFGPVEGPARDCTMILDPGLLVTRLDGACAPAPAWRHDGGGCVDGLAQGIARFIDPDGGQRVVGRFDQGLPERFVFVDDDRGIRQLGPLRTPALAGQLVRKLNGQGPDYLYFGEVKDGQPDGLGVVAFDFRPAGVLRIERFGQFRQGRLDGQGAHLSNKNVAESGKLIGVDLGSFRNGRLDGPGGWTNNGDKLVLGHWQDGTLQGQGAIYWANLFEDGQRYWRVGRFQDGQLDGRVTLQWHNGDQETESWQMGRLIDEQPVGGGSDSGLGQALALMGGLGVIGAADLPPDMALELGTAYVMDVTSHGGGNATMRTAERLAHASDRAGSYGGGHVPAQPARPAGTMASETYRFTCPSGQSHEIVVPYLDPAKLAVKKSFARSMACNLVDDMQAAMQACMAAFGRSDCGEGLEQVAEDPLG